MAADAQIQVIAELVAKVDSAVAGFNQAADGMNNALQKMKEHVNTTMGETSTLMTEKAVEGGTKAGAAGAASFNESFRTGLLAAAAFIGAEFLKTVQEKVEEAAAYATHLNILQVETGASKEELQRLTYAFQSVGLTGDSAGMAVARMGRAIEQAAAMGNGRSIIERMGLDPKAMKAETFKQQFDQIANAISGLKNQDDKLSAASQLFGRAGATSMLPLLNQGADAINKVADSADAAGAVLDTTLNKKLEDLHVAMMQAATTARNFYAALASPFITPITEVIRSVQQIRAEFQKLSDQARGSVMFAAVAATAIAFERLLDVVKTLKVFPSFLNEVLVKMSAFLEPLAAIIALVGLLWNAWQTNFAGIREIVSSLFSTIVMFVNKVTEAFKETANEGGPEFKRALKEISDTLGPVLADLASLIAWLVKVLPIQSILWVGFHLVAGALLLVIDLILQFVTDLEWLFNTAKSVLEGIFHSVADVLHGLQLVLNALHDLVAAIPGLGGLADAFGNAADQAGRMADNVSRAADAMHGAGVVDTGNSSYGSWDAAGASPKKKPTGVIAPVTKGGGAGEAAKEAVTAIKDAMEPLKDALKNTEAHLKELEIAMKKLGEIDAPNKLAAAQRIFNQQLAATSQELRQQHALTVAAHEGSTKLHALERSTKDPKIAREYHSASRSMSDESLTSHLKELDLELKMVELKKQKNKQELDYMKLMEEGSNTFAGRLKWLERKSEILLRMVASAKALNEVHKQILETIKKQNESSEQAAEAPHKASAAEAARTRELLQAGVKGSTETPQGKQAVVVAEAQATLTEANENAAVAQLKVTEANENLHAATVAHVTDESILKELNRAVAEAMQQLRDAQTKQLVSTQDLTNAQTQLARDGMATFNRSMNSVTDALLGPFSNAVKDISTEIAGGMNPSTAILSSLFSVLAKDSRSFNDIQKVMTAIAEALAKSLDALRPVVDLLLGILTGVVNMFIGLFNIMATILNVFGLHIMKIQSVNDQLAIMGKAVPLLQITHDLPTANEYNQGKWGPLMTQQMQQQSNNLNNNLTVGFNNQLNKLGQIFGELIAIKVLLGVAGVAGMGPGLGSIFGKGGKGGPMGIISGLLSFGGGGSTSAAAAGSGSVGTAEASATWDSGGAADKILKQNVGSGGMMDTVLGKHLGSGGTMATSLTTTLAAIGGGMEIIKGLGKGGNMGETLGGVGAIAGTIFGGPVGGAIGQALGSIIGGMIGPKLSATKNPDIKATQQFGQGMANVGGPMSANGQQFTEDPSLAQSIGGQTEGSAISAYIKKTGGAGLSPQTVQFFKDWQDGMTSLHNGVVTFKNGQSALWSDVLTMAQTAMQKVGGSISSTLQGAAALNLGTTFGNGTVSAINGGFTVTPGAGVLAQGDSGGASSGPSVLLNIEKVYGTDPAAIKAAFEPIVTTLADQISRQSAQRTRTQAHAVGRNQ